MSWRRRRSGAPAVTLALASARPLVVVLGLAVGLAATGCGASPAHHHLPGAEPAVSPVPAQTPAGRTVAVGAQAEGIVADPAARLVAVAVREPDRIVLIDARSGTVRRHLPWPGPRVTSPSPVPPRCSCPKPRSTACSSCR